MADQDLTSGGTPIFTAVKVGANTLSEGDVAKNKFDATADPTVNNDTSEGYAPGSVWVNVTGDNVFVCSDNTDGAAVWNDINGSVEVYGGEYSAVASNTTNLDSTPSNHTARWSKVGGMVTVSGLITIDPTTTATLTKIDLALPQAYALSSPSDLTGTAVQEDSSSMIPWQITANISTNKAFLAGYPITTSSTTIAYIYTYFIG